MPVGTVFARLETLDPNPEQTHTYTLVNAGSSLPFALQGNTIMTTQVLNFEVISSYTVTIRSMDPFNLTRDDTFVLRVVDVNDAPTVTLLPALVQAATEAGANDAVEIGFRAGVGLYDVQLYDEDWSQRHTVTLSGPNVDYFAYQFNQLVLQKDVGSDAPSTLTVTVTATDNGNPAKSGSTTRTITVKAPRSGTCTGSNCVQGSAGGSTSSSSSAGGPALYAALGAVGGVLVVGALIYMFTQRNRRQKAELKHLQALKRDMRSPFNFQAMRWFDAGQPDFTNDGGSGAGGSGAHITLSAAPIVGQTRIAMDESGEGDSSADDPKTATAAADDNQLQRRLSRRGSNGWGSQAPRKKTAWFFQSNEGVLPRDAEPAAPASEQDAEDVDVQETSFATRGRKATMWQQPAASEPVPLTMADEDSE